jgi:hypothetical protein
VSKYRKSNAVDNNQKDIVKALRAIPGVTVAVDKDDIFVGRNGFNFWYEIKNPEQANKSGKVYDSAKKDSQKRLEKEWKGHYKIVSNIDEILEDLND